MVKDPICGMEVNPKKAKYMLKKDGKDNYFCSKNCFEKFKNKSNKKETKLKSLNKSSKTIISIKGMSCASCAIKVEKNLNKQNGVKTANVNLATSKASIEFDSDKMTHDKLEQSIK